MSGSESVTDPVQLCAASAVDSKSHCLSMPFHLIAIACDGSVAIIKILKEPSLNLGQHADQSTHGCCEQPLLSMLS